MSENQTPNDDMYAAFVEDAKVEKAVSDASREADRKYKPAYLEDGTYTFRMYPDFSQRKLRLVHSLWSHKWPDIGKFHCGADGCLQCAQVNKLYEADIDDAYRQDAKEEWIIHVDIKEMSIEKSDFLKKDQALPLIVDWRVKDAVRDFFAALNPKDVRTLLEDDEAFGIILEYKRGKGGYANMSLSSFKKYKRSPKPEDFPTLDTSYLQPTDLPDENQLKAIQKYVDKIVNKSGVNFHDPEKNGSKSSAPPPAPAPSSQNKSSASSPPSSPAPSPAQAASASDRRKPKCEMDTISEDKKVWTDTSTEPPVERKLKFGEHPIHFGSTTKVPTCMTCLAESACKKQSKETVVSA